MKLFRAKNGPMQTTAAFAPVTTGTSIKTLLQLATPANVSIAVVEWGISFDGSAAATPGKVELIETDVAATVTAFVAADLTKYGDASADASLLTLGTSASGYTATVEGSVAAVRDGDTQLIAPTNQYVKQFPLGQEFVIRASKFLRIRVTFGAAINAHCYVVWGE
jgi:hypothetical protein